ncbi:MAG TPA: response regulator [Longimicrobiaceae bacterium]|nr:response regulator [Longimicrobiaceae bacterium]
MSKTVLIVDDNEHERQIFARFLGFVGGSVLEAENGEEGLRMAREHLPDLVLLDLTMPVMDGWEALRRLREDPLTGSIPVIALTAHHLDRAVLEEAGFCAYLEKPIVPVRVMQEVERCIGRLHLEPVPAPSAAGVLRAS